MTPVSIMRSRPDTNQQLTSRDLTQSMERMMLNFSKRYKWVPTDDTSRLLLPLPPFEQFPSDLQTLFEVCDSPRQYFPHLTLARRTRRLCHTSSSVSQGVYSPTSHSKTLTEDAAEKSRTGERRYVLSAPASVTRFTDGTPVCHESSDRGRRAGKICASRKRDYATRMGLGLSPLVPSLYKLTSVEVLCTKVNSLHLLYSDEQGICVTDPSPTIRCHSRI